MPNEGATFMKVKNTQNRPLEINFAKEAFRIPARQFTFIDEVALSKDVFAKEQFDGFVNSKKLRIIQKGLTNQ